MIDQTKQKQLTIGQFGRLSQLSRKALRLYEDKGLLYPVRIDPDSGYRYYVRAQVATARRIRLLGMMAMPLDDIAAVEDPDLATLSVALRAMRNLIAQGSTSAGAAQE